MKKHTQLCYLFKLIFKFVFEKKNPKYFILSYENFKQVFEK